jgi:hypothetical protein
VFPEKEGVACRGNPSHSPLTPPDQMNSSSSDREYQDLKTEPLDEGRNFPLDPNDEFDLRNGIFKSGTDSDSFLSNTTDSDKRVSRTERNVFTHDDVLKLKQTANCWATAD